MRRAAAIVYLMSLTATAGDVYRSVDAQGHVQYSDTPSPGAELVHIQDPRGAPVTAATPGPPPTAGTPPSASAGSKPADPIHEQLEQEDAKRSVQNDLADTHAEQCKQARANYQQVIEAHRLYKSGSDGERVYLTDEESDQMRLNARLQMESACKGS